MHSFTSSFANIITGGTLTWGAYQVDSTELIRVDKMNVTINIAGLEVKSVLDEPVEAEFVELPEVTDG